MVFYVLKAYTMQNIFSSNTDVVMEVIDAPELYYAGDLEGKR